jgi:hypothetical protein
MDESIRGGAPSIFLQQPSRGRVLASDASIYASDGNFSHHSEAAS